MSHPFKAFYNYLRKSYIGVCLQITDLIMTLQRAISFNLNILLFVVGLIILSIGVTNESLAAFGSGRTMYNDQRIADATNAVLTYLEGSLGALVMVAAGIGCILSAAFGQYRSAIGLLIVAIGSFILRSIVSTFFNDQTIQE